MVVAVAVLAEEDLVVVVLFIQHYHVIFTVRIFSQTCRGPVARLLLRRPQSLRSGRVMVVAVAVLAEEDLVVVVLAEVDSVVGVLVLAEVDSVVVVVLVEVDSVVLDVDDDSVCNTIMSYLPLESSLKHVGDRRLDACSVDPSHSDLAE